MSVISLSVWDGVTVISGMSGCEVDGDGDGDGDGGGTAEGDGGRDDDDDGGDGGDVHELDPKIR